MGRLMRGRDRQGRARLTFKRPMMLAIGLAGLLSSLTLVPAAALADEQEDQQACIGDALAICSQFIPDREQVAGCLIANRSRVSPACQVALTHFKPQGVPTHAKLAVFKPQAAPAPAKLSASANRVARLAKGPLRIVP